MKHKTNRRSILGDAHEIAHKVTKVDTEFRGFLLMAVAANLEQKGQYSTASLFRQIANQYGVKEPEDRDNPVALDFDSRK